MVQRLYARDTAAENRVCCRNITFQVTSGCNLRCSYCYEHHKSVERMSIETGRKVVDYILDLYEKNESDFVNQNTRAVVLDFIGGEPLLEAELIEHICDYWFQSATAERFRLRRSRESALRRMASCGFLRRRSTCSQNIMR